MAERRLLNSVPWLKVLLVLLTRHNDVIIINRFDDCHLAIIDHLQCHLSLRLDKARKWPKRIDDLKCILLHTTFCISLDELSYSVPQKRSPPDRSRQNTWSLWTIHGMVPPWIIYDAVNSPMSPIIGGGMRGPRMAVIVDPGARGGPSDPTEYNVTFHV